MVARFEPQKDHETLLQALAGLADRLWELDLIGDGPLRSQMEDLTASLRLSTKVRFLGHRTDVDRCLAEAQISVLATNWEGFPLTILEAMRAGLPVVASSVGGVGEAVRDEHSGYLVPRGDAIQLRDRIVRLLSSPGLRATMGAHGRMVWEQNFTHALMVERTLGIYRQVLENSRGLGQSSAGVVAGLSA
jgi:glycosyltransferase involved in cell wall biosynthesis